MCCDSYIYSFLLFLHEYSNVIFVLFCFTIYLCLYKPNRAYVKSVAIFDINDIFTSVLFWLLFSCKHLYKNVVFITLWNLKSSILFPR